MKKILVVSPHPDDETLGAAGYLLREYKKNNEIYWLIVTGIKKEYGYSDEICERRHREIEKVASRLHIKKYFEMNLEPAGLDKYSLGEIIGDISMIIKEVEPNVVILPNPYDAHSDHKVVYESVMACTKSFRYPSVEDIICMQIISETENSIWDRSFTPNMYVALSNDELEEKIAIASIYDSEMGDFPFPRSNEAIKALAAVNGIACGEVAAEAFRIIKHIER